jgi:pilus assembly protein CpaC
LTAPSRSSGSPLDRSTLQIMLNGKTPGETSLIVWQQGGERQFFNVQVHASNFAVDDRLDSLRRELRTELPGQTLRVTSENGLIFLRGTVKDLTSSDRAVQIASTAGKVVNLLYVDVPPAEPQILLKVRFASLDRNKDTQLGLNVFSFREFRRNRSYLICNQSAELVYFSP